MSQLKVTWLYPIYARQWMRETLPPDKRIALQRGETILWAGHVWCVCRTCHDVLRLDGITGGWHLCLTEEEIRRKQDFPEPEAPPLLVVGGLLAVIVGVLVWCAVRWWPFN